MEKKSVMKFRTGHIKRSVVIALGLPIFLSGWPFAPQAWALVQKSAPGAPASAGIQPQGASLQKVKRLNLDDALALAEHNSPLLQAAQQRIGEAQGRLVSASLLLQDNPELSLTLGPRLAPAAAASLDVELGVEQRLQIAGQRGHRIDRARAEKKSAQTS